MCGRRLGGEEAAEAEVAQFDHALAGDEDVGRFDVWGRMKNGCESGFGCLEVCWKKNLKCINYQFKQICKKS